MPKEKFQLNKWFLDFVGTGGEAMIFYAAKLIWQGLVIPYTSWLSYHPEVGVSQRSRFRNVQMPERTEDLILWSDSKFGVEGAWKSLARPLHARLFDSGEGYLDWHCFQPASKVRLQLSDRTLVGRGYVEQLLLTTSPWNIPMDELRWGRFGSTEDQLVWIEIKGEDKRKWLWLNGMKIEKSVIEDDCIALPDSSSILKLDQGVVLESEKNIFSVVEKILPYIPGFNKIMPVQFLMADSFKWLSNAQFQRQDKTIATGMAIHEFVNFKV